MRIAILTPTYSPFSGIDRLVETNARQYKKQGHQVTIMCLRSDMKSKDAKIIELGMPSSPFHERLYRLFFFLDAKKIKRAAKMLQDQDLVISHFYPMNLIARKAKMLYGCKYQYYNAGVAWPRLFKNPFERFYMWLFTLFSNASIKRCDSAISISEFLRDEMRKETSIDSKVVYIPVDKSRFHAGIKGGAIRKKLNLGNDPILLYVGRISPHKGVHLLIQAYSIAKKEFPRLHLIIAGKPTFSAYQRQLENLADKDVIFAGFVPDKDLPSYYAACTIYATGSLWEGFDIPVTEAQALGKPVVAFDAGAHREVVKKGKLVPSGDVEAFAKAVVGFLK